MTGSRSACPSCCRMACSPSPSARSPAPALQPRALALSRRPRHAPPALRCSRGRPGNPVRSSELGRGGESGRKERGAITMAVVQYPSAL